MTYFILQRHSGEKIGSTFYMTHKAARAVAKRLAGKWRRDADFRGSSIKIVKEDGSLYPEIVEWVEA